MLNDKVEQASAFFSTQMLIHILRNLVSLEIFPADAAHKWVRETIDQGVGVMPGHIPQLHEIADAFDAAIEKGSSRLSGK